MPTTTATHDNAQLALLQTEVNAAGDARTKKTTDALLLSVLTTIWDMYADKAALHPRLRYLYAKKQVIDYWAASVFRDVDYDEEVKESLGQMSRNLQLIRASVVADIEEIVASLAASQSGGGYATGQLTTATPLAGLTGRPDPNAPEYRGDPRYPQRKARF